MKLELGPGKERKKYGQSVRTRACDLKSEATRGRKLQRREQGRRGGRGREWGKGDRRINKT